MTSLTILKENLTSETFLVELSRARLKRAQLVTNLVTFAWALSQRFGHPRVLGMTIPISLAGAWLFLFSYHCLQDFILDLPFPCTAGFFGAELSPHLRLFLMISSLCNCVTTFPVSSSAARLSCTDLKCHAYYEFKTPKRSFIHVCLFIPLFSILVFGCLESDDRSCRRLRHCSLVNSSIK